jgi:hypothetical protein
MDTVVIGGCTVSRFILGSNPFSGFSHQSIAMDREMVRYWTCARIKDTLREAESLGVNTFIARADLHIVRVLLEYWDEGGQIQWFAQTCPEIGPPALAIERAARWGASACYIHGGYADHLQETRRLEELKPAVERVRSLGLPVGLAGHKTETIRWAKENLDLDFYMCSHYNPIPRKIGGAHVAGTDETYLEEDRRAMTQLIQEIPTPVIHYKVMAAGRNDPKETFDYVARSMRPGDAVCIGIFNRDKPDMLKEDVGLLAGALAKQAE